MKTSGINNKLSSFLTYVINKKRAFISQCNDDLDSKNFLTIPKNYYRYLNEPISEDVNMNNKIIIVIKERKR